MMSSRNSSIRMLFVLLLFTIFSPICVISSGDYYKTLGISRKATLKDIKKAYRRLALEHHPDRNKGNEEASAVKFREISEAYEVLSDEKKRKRYDSGGGMGDDWFSGFERRDAYDQFNDLFTNDPFFKDALKNLDNAFENLDDLFSEKFERGNSGRRSNRGNSGNRSNRDNSGSRSNNNGRRNRNNGARERGNSLDLDGLDFGSAFASAFNGGDSDDGGNFNFKFEMKTTENGRTTSQQYRSSSSDGNNYTTKKKRQVIENGKIFTIHSMEKNGNRIEEKYDRDTLVERTINGVPEGNSRISGGEF